MSLLRGIVRTMRPHQWVKNAFVLVPVVFAEQYGNVPVVLRVLGGFALFCALASSVYFLNDLIDVEADRLHPVKRLRPIPAGVVPIRTAWLACGALAVFAIGGAFALSVAFAATLLGYLVNNLVYTFGMKRVAYVDVLSIAVGFELRVLAGSVAAGVPASRYLLLVTFLLAAFLGFGKRMHELGIATEGETRKALRAYDPRVIAWLMIGTAIATVGVYLAYTIDPDTVARFGTHALAYTSVFVLFGVLRFVWLVRRKSNAESPTDAILRDPLFLGNLGLWAVAVVAILVA